MGQYRWVHDHTHKYNERERERRCKAESRFANYWRERFAKSSILQKKIIIIIWSPPKFQGPGPVL